MASVEAGPGADLENAAAGAAGDLGAQRIHGGAEHEIVDPGEEELVEELHAPRVSLSRGPLQTAGIAIASRLLAEGFIRPQSAYAVDGRLRPRRPVQRPTPLPWPRSRAR
jgi:hypothetical protein